MAKVILIQINMTQPNVCKYHKKSKLICFHYTSSSQSEGSVTKMVQWDYEQNQFPCWIVALSNGSCEEVQFLQFLQESVIVQELYSL